MYPKNCFYQDILKEDVFMKLCPKADDIWFWAMAVLNDVKINVVEGNIRRIETSFMDFGEVGQLYDDNQKQNDILLKNILDAYPKLREQIRFDSSEYWESRYKSYVNNSTTHDLSVRGGGQLIGASGAGSYNNLAVFKAEILNAFVKEHSVQNVLEFGCGDGNQLKLAKYPYYVGLDVSKTAIECNVKQFANDTTKQFYVVGDYDFRGKEAELSLSLDVIYHLIQDEVFEDYMHNLFESSSCFVGIYASNKEEPYNSHVKHRKFSAWIEQNAKEWKLYRFIPNKYPFNEKNPNHTSFADFYFYKKDQ
ncbi:hypothetical protein LS69_006410 [Helicobacter sp. MIT 05-5294]|nr:hypothetical protein LS69_006410 [Helicobacter sp. MIT 05-5294]